MNLPDDLVILEGARTPIGSFLGALASVSATELRRRGGRYALCTVCIGGGQGIAMVVERS